MNTVKITIAIAALTLCLLCAIAIAAGCGKVEPSSVVKSSFIDARDGKEYRTVRIGELTWMAENLNFVTDSSWCYDNDASNCTKYGRLYKWNTAMKVCPAGWRLPSNDDWSDLVRAAGDSADTKFNYKNGAGARLKSKIGWSRDGNGTDDYDFSALPGGIRYTSGGFDFVGISGQWWSVTPWSLDNLWSNRTFYWCMITDRGDNDHVDMDIGLKKSGKSVRCVQK